MEKTRRLFLISTAVAVFIFTACSRAQDADSPKSSNARAGESPPAVNFEFTD